MSPYKINLKDQTATSINGISFKLTETKLGEYEGVCLQSSYDRKKWIQTKTENHI